MQSRRYELVYDRVVSVCFVSQFNFCSIVLLLPLTTLFVENSKDAENE